MSHVLLVDDDREICGALGALLRQAGYEVQIAATARDAEATALAARFDAVLLDLHLPDGSGLNLIGRLQEIDPETPIICLTGQDSASSAMRAIRSGAIDYLCKPVPRALLLGTLEAAMARSMLRRRVEALLRTPREAALPIGSSPAWQRTMDLIYAAAKTPRTTVLLTGEPGSGKEVAAALVHRLSKRQQAPFITVNAACLSPQLIESELLGHEAGAFTGAQRQRRGLFELADGGTLFLDEIGELPIELQSKLLRVLEGHPFRRVGGEREIKSDVRLVCATNRDLAQRVREGLFRADLHERLRVFEIPLPPLRERPADIAELAVFFTAKIGAEMGYAQVNITLEALRLLGAYRWPGNVRELRNVIERALVLCAGGDIDARHLPRELCQRGAATPAAPAPAGDPAAAVLTLDALILRHVRAVFESCGGNVTRAAALLGISRLALRKRLQACGLKPMLA